MSSISINTNTCSAKTSATRPDFSAHDDINDYVKPYIEFGWMDDRTQAVVAPSGLFRAGYPFTPDNNELINCSNPLLSAQEQSLICTPAQIAGDIANPGSKGNSADVEIGRRNIEGGGRTSIYEHQNFRVVVRHEGRCHRRMDLRSVRLVLLREHISRRTTTISATRTPETPCRSRPTL